MERWKTSKDKIILINYLHLKFNSMADHLNNYQKYLSVAILKTFSSQKFVQIIIKASVVGFFLVKSRPFSILFWAPLDGYAWSMKG